jgi:starch synthase
LRYGTVPIVRGVGGLEDSIRDDGASPNTNTGFKFYEYSKDAMLEAIGRAVAAYKDKNGWASLVNRCMEEDFSWEKSARAYVGLYRKAAEGHEIH